MVSSAVDPVAQAARISELAPGYKVLLYEEVFPPGSQEAVRGTATGIFDQRSHTGSLAFKINAEGHIVTAAGRYSLQAIYMRLPSSSPSSSVTHGRPWIKFDVQAVGQAMGIKFSSLTGSSSSLSNPSEMLSYLKATSGPITRVGSEQVQRTPTTHYHTTIDFNRYVDQVTPADRTAAQESVAALERISGSSSLPVDVWVDSHNLVRREEFGYQECVPGTTGKTRWHLRVEYLDFGDQPVPQPPPGNEVADVTSYITEKLKHAKLGCS